jgi:hypothetical protein
MWKIAYSWISFFLFLIMLGYLVYKYVLAPRPLIQKSDIVFQEWFASGCSTKNLLTRFGGAHNCLRLVVTRELLWVTGWFPFSLLTGFYDLEHLIPLNRIVSVETNQGWLSNVVIVSYLDDTGSRRSLRLIPKDAAGFVGSLMISDPSKVTALRPGHPPIVPRR